MEQTSLAILSAMRSTTLSSFDWALPRPAITSCRPVRISREEAAAESGMRIRYQMRRANVTRTTTLIEATGPQRRDKQIRGLFSSRPQNGGRSYRPGGEAHRPAGRADHPIAPTRAAHEGGRGIARGVPVTAAA